MSSWFINFITCFFIYLTSSFLTWTVERTVWACSYFLICHGSLALYCTCTVDAMQCVKNFKLKTKNSDRGNRYTHSKLITHQLHHVLFHFSYFARVPTAIAGTDSLTHQTSSRAFSLFVQYNLPGTVWAYSYFLISHDSLALYCRCNAMQCVKNIVRVQSSDRKNKFTLTLIEASNRCSIPAWFKDFRLAAVVITVGSRIVGILVIIIWSLWLVFNHCNRLYWTFTFAIALADSC